MSSEEYYVEERRARAREAFWDTFWDTPEGMMTGARDGIEAAIEVATRVKLTDDVVDRYDGGRFDPTREIRRKVMRKVLVACGFEVEA